MIIVAGHIVTKPRLRDDFVAASREAMVAARSAEGCRAFVVTADPLEQDQVHIYEAWDDESFLRTFRGTGPSSDLAHMIEKADVQTFDVSSD